MNLQVGINDDGSLRLMQGAAAWQACPVLEAEPKITLQYSGGNAYQGDDVRLEVTAMVEGDFIEINLLLELFQPRRVNFVGVALDPRGLEDHDRFFGDIPGFLERTGVMSAREAQAQSRSAALFGMLVSPGREWSWLAGIGGLHADPSGFFLRQDLFWAGWCPDRMLAGRLEFRLLLGCRAAPLELLSDYGERLAPLGRCAARPPTGWNSWDFYGGAVSMADLRAEMAALRRLPCRGHLQYMTVDAGWEEAWGNWAPNRRFPARSAQIAGRLRAGGWRPGIWLAPLQVNMFTPLARRRQDLFLRDEQGSLILIDTDTPCGPVLLLDFSLPEVQDLVRGWFAGLRQAGFELFKIDYLYTKFISQARYAAGGWGRVAFVRRIFEVIREAVGEDAHIVNCGGLKEAALGLVDSSRVTMDIHNFWGHIRNNARQLAQAFWMNRRLWFNDPDFAIARNPENCRARWLNMPHAVRPLTEDADFWMRGPPATRSELRLWLSAVRLNGGSLCLSDSIRELKAAGRRDLARLFPPLQDGFLPLDLFERDRPGIWLSQDRQRPTLGLFNWNDAPSTLELPTPLSGGVTGRDFWTGRPVRLSDAPELASRSGLLLEI